MTLRVLHLPADIGGNTWNLAQAERSRGLESKVLVRSAAWSSARADIRLDAGRLSARSAIELASTFLRIRKSFDIFHFNFGSSLFHSLSLPFSQPELGLYPRSARVFATYNGCDARQKYPTIERGGESACAEPDCYEGMCNSGVLDSRRKAGIDRMAARAEHIWVSNPDLVRFFPAGLASFIPYAADDLGLEARSPSRSGPLRVVHAPTQRGAKGTAYVLATFEALKRKYPDKFEFELVEGLPREAALRRYQCADVLVDQLLIGWYGLTAVEAMLLGKAVCVFIREDDLVHIPEPMREDLKSAVINVTRDTLAESLYQLAEDRSLLLNRAETGRAYARQWHSPHYVAGLTVPRYERRAPAPSR